jgi:hypothetical protein
MDSSGKNVRNNALHTTQKKKGPKIAPRVRNPNTASSTRKNNVGIQATQPLVQKIVLPDIEEQSNLPLHESENVVEAVRHPEQEQLVDHKIILSDAVEEKSVPPIRISKGPPIAPKKAESSVVVPPIAEVSYGINKSKQEAAPIPKHNEKESIPLQPIPLVDGTFPVILRHTLSQGDCFFSALYRSLHERDGLLEKIGECISLTIENESSFIQAFRDKIADIVVSGHLPYSNEKNGRLDMYDSLVQYTTNTETYEEITRGFPEWFQIEFGEHGENLGVRESFCQRLASHIRTSGEWVGEIEVRIVMEELEKCDVLIEIRSNNEENLYKTSGEKDVIHLYNPSELHYEYFSFVTNNAAMSQVVNVKKAKSSNTDVLEKSQYDNNDEFVDSKENESDDIKEEPFSKYRYDPELGTQVSSRSQMILILKKALKELESNARREEEQLSKKYKRPENMYELLIQYVLHPEFEDPLSLLTIQFEGWTRIRSKTSMFEALWNIVIGLGYLPGFPIEYVQLLDWRGVNKSKAPQVIHNKHNASDSYNILSIFKHMKFGTSASGVSDITFLYHHNSEDKVKPRIEGCSSCEEKPLLNRMFISSVKFFELDIKKNVENFDIAPLMVAADILKKEEIDYDILLFVKDSNAVSNIVENARKRYLTSKIKEGGNKIFGESHLKYAIQSLREVIQNHMKEDIISTIEALYGRTSEPKSYLSLRFHQELMVEKTHHYLSTTSDSIKQVLIGVLPRGGKTYICGGIISKRKPNIVLVLTHVPKETHKQFLNDLFYKFADFSDYKVIYLKDEEHAEEIERKSEKMIIFTSYQLVKMAYALKAKDVIARDMIDKLKSGEIDETTELDHIHKEVRSKLASLLKSGKNINQSTTFYPIKRSILKGLIEKTIIPDMCFFDEAHFGNGGVIAQEVYSTLHPNTIRILMTATYIKPFYQFNIKPSQLFHWDYQDIQLGKNLTNADVFKQFRERHILIDETDEETSTIFDIVIASQAARGNGIKEIQQIYSKFPNIELITTQFEDKAIESFQGQLLQDSSRGISMDAIFAINNAKKVPSKLSDTWTLFSNPGIVGKLLNYIGPNDDSRLRNLGGESVPHIEGDLGSHFNIMDRIYQDSYVNGNRLTRSVPHTQIWFIPPSNGIQKRIIALASALLHHPWFNENFCVIGVYGGESDKIAQTTEETESKITAESFIDGNCFNMSCGNSSDLKECIEKEERENRCMRKKGTIILTGFMLRMGISLGCADVVMLLDDDTDPDATTQKTFRALTESEGKKKAYVVDLNPQRSIHAICQHIRGIQTKTDINNHTMYQTVINTFGINTDRFLFASPGGKPIDYHQLYEQVRGIDETVSSSKYLKKLENAAIDMTSALDDKDISSILMEDFKQSKLRMFELKEQDERNPNQNNNESKSFGTGKQRVRVGPPPPPKTPKPKPHSSVPEQTDEQRFEIFKQIIETTLKLIAFTYNSQNLHEVHEQLRVDSEAQDLVFDTLVKRGLIRLFVIWESDTLKDPKKYTKDDKEGLKLVHEQQKAEMIADIITSLEHMIDKKINSTYRGMKKKANDPTADQQDVLKYIDKYLAPTAELKDEYGEVFTPMWLVNEMLDKLEEVEPAIFKDKTKKWLDPANGMGNFPVAVFYRLMKQLHGVSPQNRAKYIVENMLYMMEFRKENTAKCKRIFSKLAPGVEPNMITTDSLEITYKELKERNWPIHFDIVMGNPPYNPPKTGTGSSGNVIWPNFVVKSNSMLKNGGYLLFVHPPGWKKPTEDDFKEEKFSTGNYNGQIRQGQVWNILKATGVFKFIYTNDQRSKAMGKEVFIPHFPAVDYYVYQKDGNRSTCDTKNIFLGEITEANSVRLNYNLNYLPNLITKQTQDILHKVTSKDGDKPDFGRYRNGKGFSVDSSKGKYRYIYTYNKHSEPKYQYSDTVGDNNINQDKVIMNFDGGIDCFTVQYVKKEEQIGSYEMTMYTVVDSNKKGKQIESFFSSDIVKFIFLITQYASGKMTKNEPLVANSITIPPDGVDDYYRFFGIQEHKKYIEDVLAHYTQFKAPKRVAKTEKKTSATKKGGNRFQKTRKNTNKV